MLLIKDENLKLKTLCEDGVYKSAPFINKTWIYIYIYIYIYVNTQWQAVRKNPKRNLKKHM